MRSTPPCCAGSRRQTAGRDRDHAPPSAADRVLRPARHRPRCSARRAAAADIAAADTAAPPWPPLAPAGVLTRPGCPHLAEAGGAISASARTRSSRCTAERNTWVDMIGSWPGFPFMGDLPGAAAPATRRQPRVRVPAGSVAIATGLTATTPGKSPGGWHRSGAARCRCSTPAAPRPRRSRPETACARPGERPGTPRHPGGLASAENRPTNGLEAPDPRGERSMSTRTEVEILSPGAFASIQDGGRLRPPPHRRALGGRRPHRRLMRLPMAGRSRRAVVGDRVASTAACTSPRAAAR